MKKFIFFGLLTCFGALLNAQCGGGYNSYNAAPYYQGGAPYYQGSYGYSQGNFQGYGPQGGYFYGSRQSYYAQPQYGYGVDRSAQNKRYWDNARGNMNMNQPQNSYMMNRDNMRNMQNMQNQNYSQNPNQNRNWPNVP